MCLLQNEGVPSFWLCSSLFFVCSSEGWKEALPPFECVMATVGRMVFLDSRCGLSSSLSRSSIGNALLSVRSHVACVFKHSQITSSSTGIDANQEERWSKRCSTRALVDKYGFSPGCQASYTEIGARTFAEFRCRTALNRKQWQRHFETRPLGWTFRRFDRIRIFSGARVCEFFLTNSDEDMNQEELDSNHLRTL